MGGERSQGVHAALEKPGLTLKLHLYEAEGEAVRAELSPMLSGEAVASRAVQGAGDGTHGPQQPHSLQDRGEGWEDGNCWEPGLKLECSVILQ